MLSASMPTRVALQVTEPSLCHPPYAAREQAITFDLLAPIHRSVRASRDRAGDFLTVYMLCRGHREIPIPIPDQRKVAIASGITGVVKIVMVSQGFTLTDAIDVEPSFSDVHARDCRVKITKSVVDGELVGCDLLRDNSGEVGAAPRPGISTGARCDREARSEGAGNGASV